MEFRMTGLVAATFTPMRPDGSLNLQQVQPLVDRLVDERIGGLFVCGSTGEGPSLSLEERRQTAAAYTRAAAGRLPVVIHVGHNCLAEARILAAHAAEIGADAVSACPPSYFRPGSVTCLVDCLAEIAAGAPQLPFYYYHIPSITGVELDMLEFLREGGGRLPTLVGIKYTAYQVHEYQSLLAADGGRFDILFGRDEMLLSGLSVGARGAIGSTYNMAAPLYHRVIEAFRRGDLDEARRQQGLAVELIRVLLAGGGLPAFKALMGILGIDCGPCRLPIKSLDPQQTGQLREDLQSLGFFDWGR